jgi:integrase
VAKSRYGVRRRGKKWIAKPYVPGRGHIWAGTFDTEQEAAKAALARIEEERVLPANKETVASFAARWVRDFPRPKESTNDRYRADAKRFAKEFGDRKLHEISVPEAMAYARQHRHDLGALRSMYSDARRSGLVTSNPFRELGIPKGPGRSKIVVITEGELQTLLGIARRVHGPKFGPVFAAVIEFAAATTMRPGEVFGLDRSDVDFAGEVVHVRRQFHKLRIQLPKNGEQRTLPYLPPRAAQAIRSMPRQVPAPICGVTGGEILFPGTEGQRITAGSLSRYWKPVRAAFEATVPAERLAEFDQSRGSLDFYSLRHYGATRMVEAGVESWIVAKMMGHEDGGRLVEKVYGHPRDEVARERLRRAFGQNVRELRPVDGEEAANG